jgi:hypothetical protein
MKFTDFDEIDISDITLDDVLLLVDLAKNVNKLITLRNLPVSDAVKLLLDLKQEQLVSGVNIKTVNGNSLLGPGDVPISGGGGGGSANLIIDYDYNIVGARDGVNTNFSTALNFKSGTTRVYLNGQRLTLGVGYDYVEVGLNQISLEYSPLISDRLIIEYELY